LLCRSVRRAARGGLHHIHGVPVHRAGDAVGDALLAASRGGRARVVLAYRRCGCGVVGYRRLPRAGGLMAAHNCNYCSQPVEHGGDGQLYDATGEGAPHYCEPPQLPDWVLCAVCNKEKWVYPDGRQLNLDGSLHRCQTKPNYTKPPQSVIRSRQVNSNPAIAMQDKPKKPRRTSE
jgi:hypothetical protein